MFKWLTHLFAASPHRAGADDEAREAFGQSPRTQPPLSVPPLVQEALREFVELAAEPLGAAEARRLASSVAASLAAGSTASEALWDGLVDDDGQQRGKWLLIQLDWKDVDEIGWQAEEIADAYGLPDSWRPERDFRYVPEAMASLARWFAARGYALLDIDTGGDAYACLAAPQGNVEELLELAREATLVVKVVPARRTELQR